MAFYLWSRTANTNANADPTINYQEGQAPSSLNDSARNAMAALAMWRDDIAGAIITGGTSTAYTVTTYSGFTSLALLNGQVVAFTPHVTNGQGPVQLNVDGIGQKPLRSAPNVDLQSGVLIQGTPYAALYNNADGAFYLFGVGAAPGIPLGMGGDYWGTTTPSSAFAFPTGQAISRTTYAALFALMGTTYGAGDGTTTFNLPDKTGRVSAMKEAAASRLTSSFFGGNSANLGASGGSEKNALSSVNQLPQFTPSGSVTTTSTFTGSGLVVTNGAGGTSGGGSAPGLAPPGGTVSSVSTFSGNPVGSASPSSFAVCQPTIICNYIIRVL